MDNLVECLHPVGAAVALARVATVARPPCLGAGAVARGEGTGDQTEAAEVLAGRCCLLTFTIPTPHGGCTCRGQGVAHAERAFDEKGVLSGASSVHSDGSAMGNWSRRQPLIIVIFRWGGCTEGTGTRHGFRHRARHVINAETTQK